VTDHGSRAATGSTLTVDAANAAFTPTCFDHVPRGAVTLRVRNTGASLHNVQVTAQHVDVDVAPGHTAVVHLTIGRDPVVYVCKYHRTLGMVGVLVPSGRTRSARRS
jgi:plastocyanin